MAVDQSWETIVRILLSRGASTQIANNNAETVLHCAVRFPEWSKKDKEAHERIIQLLLDHGAPIYARNDEGNTPLHLAVLYRRPKMTRMLLDSPDPMTSINMQNLAGKTPYDLAVYEAREKAGSSCEWIVLQYLRQVMQLYVRIEILLLFETRTMSGRTTTYSVIGD